MKIEDFGVSRVNWWSKSAGVSEEKHIDEAPKNLNGRSNGCCVGGEGGEKVFLVLEGTRIRTLK